MDAPTESWWPSGNDDDPADQTLWQLHVTIGRGWRRGRLVFSMPVFHEDAGGAHAGDETAMRDSQAMKNAMDTHSR